MSICARCTNGFFARFSPRLWRGAGSARGRRRLDRVDGVLGGMVVAAAIGNRRTVQPDGNNCSLDAVDICLLRALLDNARASTAALARRVGLSAPTVTERVRRLEAAGVIAGYRVVLSPQM